MMRLTREVREFIWRDADAPADSRNSWAGGPAPLNPFGFVILRLTVSGEPDPTTGYLCDIREIDESLKRDVVPIVKEALLRGDSLEGALVALLSQARASAPSGVRVESLEIQATPYLNYSARGESETMISVTQQFEFSASHRLHCEDFSDEENVRIFGKCNNPLGHGHNYILEVTITGEPDIRSVKLLPFGELERIVNEQVVKPFDHKNLNLEVMEFKDLNPSVESIARVIWNRLAGRISPAKLSRIRVYETAKTWADYEG